jgi:hypothetical protein
VPKASDVYIPSDTINRHISPSDVDIKNLPLSMELVDTQSHEAADPFVNSSHASFASLVRDRNSAAATTQSGLAYESNRSKPMLSDYAEPSINQDRYAEFLERVGEKQEDLRDAREALLGSRFRLQVQRRELLATRSKAASHAGAAFNRLRQYLIELDIDLPDEIESAFSEAEAFRNTLGEQEVDYDEAEKAYDLEEWKYTAEEARFIDELPSSAPAPSQPDRSYPPFDGHEASLRFSFGPQDIANIVAESEGALYLPLYRPDIPLESDDDLSDGQSTVPGDLYQHTPDSNELQDIKALKDPKAYSDGLVQSEGLAIGHSRVKWAGTRRYIDEWLLNSLDTSELEKSRLKHSTDGDGLSDSEWWELLGQYWFLDTPEGSNYHTGDTTVSDESSGLLSSNAMRRLFDTSDTSEFETHQFPPTPLLAQDRVIDAPELIDFPTNIEPRDLVEITPKCVKFRGRSVSVQSGSTHPTVYTRASSSIEHSSYSTFGEEDLVCQSRKMDDAGQSKKRRRHVGRRRRRRQEAIRSGDDTTIQQRQARCRSAEETLCHEERLTDTTYSAPMSEHHARASNTPSAPSAMRRSSEMSDIVDHDTGCQSDPQYQSSADIARIVPNFHGVNIQTVCTIPLPESDTEDSITTFASLGQKSTRSPQTKHSTGKQHVNNYEPHIRVESPDLWSLPVYD